MHAGSGAHAFLGKTCDGEQEPHRRCCRLQVVLSANVFGRGHAVSPATV